MSDKGLTAEILADRLRDDPMLMADLQALGVYVFFKSDGERQRPWQSDGDLVRCFHIVANTAREHREFRNDLLFELASDEGD